MEIFGSLGQIARKLGNTEGRRFWTGQILSLVATVVAVYLAASVGYDKAMQYDQLLKDQDRYYLMQSMYDETKDNLFRITEIADKIGKVSNPEILGNTHIEDYVWNLMAELSETARIPSPILTGTRRFYRESSGLLESLKAYIPNPAFVKRRLEEVAARFRDETSPKIEKELARLRHKLEKNGLLLDG